MLSGLSPWVGKQSEGEVLDGITVIFKDGLGFIYKLLPQIAKILRMLIGACEFRYGKLIGHMKNHSQGFHSAGKMGANSRKIFHHLLLSSL